MDPTGFRLSGVDLDEELPGAGGFDEPMEASPTVDLSPASTRAEQMSIDETPHTHKPGNVASALMGQALGVRLKVDITQHGFARDAASKIFTVYVITVQPEGTVGGVARPAWNVYRRYSEFNKLNISLRAQHPPSPKSTFLIPILPPKKMIGSFAPEFILQRRMGLAKWLGDLVAVYSRAGLTALDAVLAAFLAQEANNPPPGLQLYQAPGAAGNAAAGAGGAGAGGDASAQMDVENGSAAAAAAAAAGTATNSAAGGGMMGNNRGGGHGHGHHGGPGRVGLEDFELVKVIGKGSFGKVMLVRKKDHSRSLFAMKVLDKKNIIKRNQVEHTKTERRVLGQIQHPFIVTLHYAFQTKTRLYFVLDYCSGGELFFHLGRCGRLRESLACFYSAEITLALGHLHDLGIVYRDLKPENILLDDGGHVCLADFGLSKEGISDGTQGTGSFCGTAEYLAPEILNRAGHGTGVDWWALGMVLYEMLTGMPPWYTKEREVLFERVRRAPLEFPQHVSKNARSIIAGFLERDSGKRLGIRGGGVKEVLAHPFFAHIDFKALYSRTLQPPFRPRRDVGSVDASNFDKIFTRMRVDPSVGPGSVAGSNTFAGFSFEGHYEAIRAPGVGVVPPKAPGQ